MIYQKQDFENNRHKNINMENPEDNGKNPRGKILYNNFFYKLFDLQ